MANKKNVVFLMYILLVCICIFCTLFYCLKIKPDTEISEIIVTAHGREYKLTEKKEIKSFTDWLDGLVLEETSYESGELAGDGKVYKITYKNGDVRQYVVNEPYVGKFVGDDIQWYQMK